MRIAFITAGTGGAFYCENCVRDHALITGLKANGHQVTTIPMYLPLQIETSVGAAHVPIFFGAVRLYLTGVFPFFKNIPGSLMNLLDHKSILKLAASRAGSTRAGGHEQMTMDMIHGERGPYANEFEKLTEWLFKHAKPDVIFISNAFLLGVASAIKVKRNIPVICLLQDEHTWVDASDRSLRRQIWDTVSDKFRHVDSALTHSAWYAKKISNHLNLASGSISVVPFGLDPSNYIPSSPRHTSGSIGYLGRVCRNLGMHSLTDAYCHLMKKTGDKNLSVHFCGGFTRDDQSVIKKSKKSVADVKGMIRLHPEFGMKYRSSYLSSLDAFSLPSQEKLTLGTSVMEALAAGVPVVQPDEGGFSEIVKATGGGILYSPNSPEALADALFSILKDKKRRMALSKRGRNAVVRKYNNVNMAREALATLQ